MSNKFGWQKANRQDATRRGSAPKLNRSVTTVSICPNCKWRLKIRFGQGGMKLYFCHRCDAQVTTPQPKEVLTH